MAPPENSNEIKGNEMGVLPSSTVLYNQIDQTESGLQRKTITLQWESIQYKVPDLVTKQEKVLLHSMSGTALPGNLMGIMGTSGAGKSTLLDVLAGRIQSKQALTGRVLVNGAPIDNESFKKCSGYVMQSDALFPLLTVRETLRYAAYLRCTGKTTEERNEIADKVITLLKLEKCAETIIGDDNQRGLSGGERRRVSIGVDFVNSPSVIFLDEPTSGLDSSTAYSVIASLKEVAALHGTTVVMTIHQPSARLFDLIDDIIFLSSGRVTYSGPVKGLKPWVASIYKQANYGAIPEGNLPEIMLDLCDQLIQDNKLDLITASTDSSVTIKSSDHDVSSTHNEGKPSYANSFLGETQIIMQRAFKNVARVPELFLARIGASVGFGVMLGTLFLNTQDDMKGIQLRLSYFVFIAAFYYYTSLEALPIFLAEREIFQREFSRGAYRASSYTLAQTLVFFPPYLVIAVLFSCITWWLINLPNVASVFFFHVLTVFTVLCAGSSFATLISTVVPSPMVGQTMGSALFSVMFLFSGFFIKSADIPDYWIWLNYLSLFKYAFESLIINDLSGVTVKEGGMVIMDNEQLMDYFSMKGIDKGRGIYVLWIFIIGFRCIFWYRLRTAFTGMRK